MITLSKKFIVDEQGHPKEVIIPWEQYQQIIEIHLIPTAIQHPKRYHA